MEREKNERELEKVEKDNKAKIAYEENRNRQLEDDIKNLH
jgi:hypothetical protein